MTEKSGKLPQPEAFSSAKAFTNSRGWETLFFLSEAVMIVFYCVGATFTINGHSWVSD